MRDHDDRVMIAAGNGDERPGRVTVEPIDPADCPNPDCANGRGRKDHRLTVQGRSPYRCTTCGELWIDAEETPRSSGKDVPFGRLDTPEPA